MLIAALTLVRISTMAPTIYALQQFHLYAIVWGTVPISDEERKIVDFVYIVFQTPRTHEIINSQMETLFAGSPQLSYPQAQSSPHAD